MSFKMKYQEPVVDFTVSNWEMVWNGCDKRFGLTKGAHDADPRKPSYLLVLKDYNSIYK